MKTVKKEKPPVWAIAWGGLCRRVKPAFLAIILLAVCSAPSFGVATLQAGAAREADRADQKAVAILSVPGGVDSAAVAALRTALPSITQASGRAAGSAAVLSPGGEQLPVQFTAGGGDLISLSDANICAGRAFSEQEAAAGAPVIVIESRQATALFGAQEVVGRQISLLLGNRVSICTVIGVAQARGGEGSGFYIPYALAGTGVADEILLRGETRVQTQALAGQAAGFLGAPPLLRDSAAYELREAYTSYSAATRETANLFVWCFLGAAMLAAAGALCAVRLYLRGSAATVAVGRCLGARAKDAGRVVTIESFVLCAAGLAAGLLAGGAGALCAGLAAGFPCAPGWLFSFLSAATALLCGVFAGGRKGRRLAQKWPAGALRAADRDL